VNAAAAGGRRLAPAAEWLLDNFYLIEEQISLARRHLPRGYSRELPRMAQGPLADLPRVYDVVVEFIAHTDGRFDAENLTRFVEAYQGVSILRLGELWAIPIMLRLALVEGLRLVAERIAARGDGFLVTRADTPMREALAARFPEAERNDVARTVHLAPEAPVPTGRGTVLLITAGTSDLPVAEEAAVTARAMGNCVERLTDVGVAGIHRLLAQQSVLTTAAVVIVVAGMDGALPSVVGGLVRAPVIAVPTSVGYGAAFGGLAPLLTMLNSCAAGVTVVNIDNGFGAAVAASRITHG
jgi:hypothetical protein